MVEIRISDSLAERLRAAAQRQNLSLDEYAERLLIEHAPPQSARDQDAALPGSTAALAASAKRANIRTGRSDVSERRREILEQEWRKHLMRGTGEQDNQGNG